MAATTIYMPNGNHPIVLGPGKAYFTVTNVVPIGGVSPLLIFGLNLYYHIAYLYLRSTIAGELRVEDDIAGAFAAITIVANTWTYVPLGAYGVMARLIGRDVQIHNLTGAIATIDAIGAYQNS